MENTEITTTQKRSGFKRTLIYLIVLGVIGGSGYLAYKQGAVDPYLPQVLKSIQEQPKAENVGANANAPTTTVTESNVTTAVPSASTDTAPTPDQAPTPQLPPSGTVNEAPHSAAAPVSVINAEAPILMSINGAPANALLTAYDAQWQWQGVEQSFKNQGDVAAALQQVQALKNQLQVTKSTSFAPTLVALDQVEAQLQAWMPLHTMAYLNTLQQAINNVDTMVIKTTESEDATQMAASTEGQSWWQGVLASLKNVIQVKRIDEQKNTAALSASTVALVKQSIVARLSSAQLAAQMGQWQQVQGHARAAQALATQWADAGILDQLKPILEVASFPASPDFSTVASALRQARTQLVNEAHAAQALPTPTAPAVANPTVSTPAVKEGGV